MAEELFDAGLMVTKFEGRLDGPNGLIQAAQRAPELVSRSVASINQVLNGAGSVGFSHLGTAAQKAATSISTSFAATSAQVNVLSGKFNEGQAALRGYDARIAEARSSMALLNQKIIEGSHATEVDKQAIAALKREQETLSASTRILVGEKGKLAVEVRNTGAALKIEEAILRSETAAQKAAAAEAKKLADAHVDLSTRVSNFGGVATRAGTALSIGITAPLVLAAREVVKTGSSFESAFAGVRKTVEASEPQLALLRQGFRDLAKEIPVSANELARIGEAAGQLGVKTPQILSFTRVVADLGVATNLVGEQGASSLAQFANIIKNEAGPQFDRLGSTIVALGNAGASTEKDILEMGLRIAGAGKLAKISEAEILGIANALSSVGIEAEAGGSSISRVITKMTDAVALGNSQLRIFAAVSGESTAQFKKHFEQDAAGALVSFIEGLGRMAAEGKSLTPVLEKLELADIRVSDALKRAAGSGDLFRQSLETGSRAWRENTALTEEARKRYETFDSQVQLLENRFKDVAITVFDTLRPSLLSLVDKLSGVANGLKDIDPQVIKTGAIVAAVLGIGGPVLIAIGAVATSVSAMVAAFTGPAGIVLAIGALAALRLAGGDAANGLASMWAKITGDASSGSATMVSHINKVTDALQVSLAAYLGWRAAGVPGAVAGGLIGASLLPKNPTSPTSTRFAQPGTATQSGRSLQEDFARLNPELSSGKAFKWREFRDTATKEGQGIGAGIMSGVNAGIKNNPAISPDLKGLLEKAKSGGGGAGKAMGKAMLDEFQAGSAGFTLALNKVLGAGDLSKLFDPITKGARAGAEQTKKALEAVASGINSYFQSFNAGITVTPELLANFPKAVIQNLGLASGALMKAKEDQASHLIALNEAYRSQGIGLQAILKDGVIVIQQKGKETVDIIAENARRAAQADNLSQVFKKAGSDLEFTLNERNQIIASTGKVAVQSAQGVASELTASLGPKMFADINTGIRAEGNKLADTFVSMWENVRKEQGVSAAETARLATEAFNKLKPDVQKEIKPAFDELIFQLGRPKAALEDLKNALDRNPIYVNLKTALDVRSTLDSVIGDFERYGQQLGLSGQQLENYVETSVRGMGTFGNVTDAELERAIEAHKRAANQLPGIWESIFRNLDSSSRKSLNSVFAVIDTLPGKWGDALRKGQSEIEKFLKFLDSSIHLIERLLGEKTTEGLAGVVQSIVGIFKKGQSSINTIIDEIANDMHVFGGLAQQTSISLEQVQADMHDFGGLATQTGDQVGGAFKKMGSDAGQGSSQIQAALALAASSIGAFLTGQSIGGVKGGIIGGLSGALAGFASAGIVGAAIGGVSGILGAIFGKGKSKEQEAAEKAAAERAKLDAQQVGQNIVNSYLDGLSKALDFASKVSDYTKIPKKAFNQFFADFRKILDEFVALSKIFTASMTDKMKAFAEGVGPAIDLLGNAVNAFTILPSLTSVPQRAFDAFGSAMTGVIVTFAGVIEGIENKLINHARKLAKKTGETVQLIKDGVEGFNALATFKGVATSAITGFGSALLAAVMELDKVFQQFDNAGLKQSQRFSERSLSIVNLIGQGVASFVQLASFGGISTDAAVKFGSALSFAIQTIATVALSVGTDLVASAQRFSDKAGSSVQLIGTAITSFKDLADIKEIPLSAIAALGNGIHAAVQALVGIASVIGSDAIEAAGKFSSSAVDVFKLISESVKGFTDLGNLRDIYPAAIENLSNGIELAVNAMGRLAQKIDSKLLAEAQKVSSGFNAVLSTVSAGVSAFKDLGIDDAGKPPTFAISGIDSLFGNIEYAIKRMIGLSNTVDEVALNKAVSFGQTSLGIFNAMKEGIGLLKLLPEIPGIAIASYDAFVSGVLHVVSTLSRSLQAVLEAHGISVIFKDAAAQTDSNIAAGIASLGTALSRSTNALSNISSGTSIGSSFAPQSFTPAFITPVAPSQGQSGNQKNYYFTFHGPVNSDAELKDRIVRIMDDLDDEGRQ